MKKSKLGRVQYGIMQVLWRRGRATAREITDEMNRAKSDCAFDGADLIAQVGSEGRGGARCGRAHVCVSCALYEESEVQVAAARELLARAFDNSALGLVAHSAEARADFCG